MKRILTIVEPVAKGLQYHAYYQMMLAGRNDYDDIILSNYITLCSRHNVNGHIDFWYQGILERHPQGLDKFKICGQSGNIINDIKRAIDNNCYVVLNINEFFLKNRSCYQTEYFAHDYFIYGYNDKEQIFYSAGYDEKMHFILSENSFVEIERGYYSLRFDYQYVMQIFRRNNTKVNLDKDKIYQKLNEYMQGINPLGYRIDGFLNGNEIGTWNDNSGKQYYGINTYDFLLEMLENNPSYGQVRSFSVLCEHKKIIEMVFNKIYDNRIEIISENIKALQQKSATCKMLFLKYQVKSSDKTITNIKNNLINMKNLECELLSDWR